MMKRLVAVLAVLLISGCEFAPTDLPECIDAQSPIINDSAGDPPYSPFCPVRYIIELGVPDADGNTLDTLIAMVWLIPSGLKQWP